MKNPIAALLPLLGLLSLSACQAEGPAVTLNGQEYSVEVAANDASRIQGLMFRDTMPERHGMLFVFEDLDLRSFWMKNTRIPLDILYFDADLRLVSVSENARPCRTPRCPSYPSSGPAKYVLELNAGQAKALGVKPGDELKLQGIATDAKSP